MKATRAEGDPSRYWQRDKDWLLMYPVEKVFFKNFSSCIVQQETMTESLDELKADTLKCT